MENIREQITTVAAQKAGIPSLKPLQIDAIQNLMEASASNRGQIVILPTGYGKTLCFTLPAFLKTRLTVIIYPLTALIADQQRRIESSGFHCSVITGKIKLRERKILLEEIPLDLNSFILTTPEQLSHPALLTLWKNLPMGHLVFDEAHTIIKWGESFRSACLTAVHSALFCSNAYLSAFTATAGTTTLDRLRSFLFDTLPIRIINTVPDKANLEIRVQNCFSPLKSIRSKIASENLPMLIFCRSRNQCEVLAWQLDKNASVRAYHAGFDHEKRSLLEAWFMKSTDGILISTCAYGLGMDKPDIRTIIHTDPPNDIEAYLQECGRAGRDGKKSTAFLFYNADKTYSPVWETFFSKTGCVKTRLYSTLGYEGQIQCGACSDCSPEQIQTDYPPGLNHRLLQICPGDRAAVLSGKPSGIIEDYPWYQPVADSWPLDETDDFLSFSPLRPLLHRLFPRTNILTKAERSIEEATRRWKQRWKSRFLAAEPPMASQLSDAPVRSVFRKAKGTND